MFAISDVDELGSAGVAEGTVSGAAPEGGLLRSTEKSAAINARDRRLMLLFFDFSGMDPEQIDRSVDAAKKFVQTRMQPADLIALVSLRSEEHTSELQSHLNLVCRLLLEKKKKK